MDLYQTLDAYPDAAPCLQQLKRAGLKTAILSNGSKAMLASAVESAHLGNLLDAVLSVDEVGIFKPDFSIYRLVVDRFEVQPGAVCFVSSNGWDAQCCSRFRLPGRLGQSQPTAARTSARHSGGRNTLAVRATRPSWPLNFKDRQCPSPLPLSPTSPLPICASGRKRRDRRHEVEVPLEMALPHFHKNGHRAGDLRLLMGDWSQDPESALLSQETQAFVRRAIEGLPDLYRTVVLLRDVEGLSNEDVAEILGESVAAVKSRLHRARMVLREELTHHLGPRARISWVRAWGKRLGLWKR